jgi:hypothetical protein
MNQKLIEASLGMLARMIPPEIYAAVSADLKNLVDHARSIDERLKRIEAATVGLPDRVAMLESVVRSTVDGAEAIFAERDMWLVPGSIEKALAPAEENTDGR